MVGCLFNVSSLHPLSDNKTNQYEDKRESGTSITMSNRIKQKKDGKNKIEGKKTDKNDTWGCLSSYPENLIEGIHSHTYKTFKDQKEKHMCHTFLPNSPSTIQIATTIQVENMKTNPISRTLLCTWMMCL
jgi:hypothetical protein